MKHKLNSKLLITENQTDLPRTVYMTVGNKSSRKRPYKQIHILFFAVLWVISAQLKLIVFINWIIDRHLGSTMFSQASWLKANSLNL